MLVDRIIKKLIEEKLFKGKIIIIYGARQVGKTTLVKEIQNTQKADSVYLNCDEPDVRLALTDKTSTELKAYIGSRRLVVIDEAQRVSNIGLTLKLINDNFPEIQVIATGSSSFDLSNKISEPLTGRNYEFTLYPLSINELGQAYSDLEIERVIEQRMVFGMYPGIVNAGTEAEEKLKISPGVIYIRMCWNSRISGILMRSAAWLRLWPCR